MWQLFEKNYFSFSQHYLQLLWYWYMPFLRISFLLPTHTSNVLILSYQKLRYREHFLKIPSHFCLKKISTAPPLPLWNPCATRLLKANIENFNFNSSTSCNWFLPMVKYSREMKLISSNRVRQCLWLRGRSNFRQPDTLRSGVQNGKQSMPKGINDFWLSCEDFIFARLERFFGSLGRAMLFEAKLSTGTKTFIGF